MGHIVRVNLGNNDSIIKTWWQQALSEGVNVSAIISKAILIYDMTGTYSYIGNISEPDKELPNVRKVVYLPETETMKGIIDKWLGGESENKGLGPTIKRIIRRGITDNAEKGNVIADVDDLIDKINMIKSGKFSEIEDNKSIQQSVKPLISEEPQAIEESHHINEKNEAKIMNKQKQKNEKPNIMLSMIASGCGLGEP